MPGLPDRRLSKPVLWTLYVAGCVPLFLGSCGVAAVGREAVRCVMQYGLLTTFQGTRLFVDFGFFGNMTLLGASCFVLPWCLRRNRNRAAYWTTVALVSSLAMVMFVSYVAGL